MQTLEQRVESLEKANRRWRWWGAMMAGTAVIVTAMANAKPKGEVAELLRAHALEITDQAGTVLARIDHRNPKGCPTRIG